MRLREQTLELRKRILGNEHPRSMNDLARSYSILDQDKEAKQLREQTLKLRKRI